MIRAVNLVKRYGDVEAVRGLNFSIRPGEITGYLGPNGAGKSTTVKMIVGLLRPSEGAVEVCGFNVAEEPLEAKRRLGYVPENGAIYGTLSVLEYLSLTAELYHLDPIVARIRIAQMLEGFELARLAGRQIDTLSKGQRQKVLLIGALLHHPDVLVLDEPLTGLDAASALTLRQIMEHLAKQGKTVLFCSHVLDVVERVCQRVIVLHEGRVVADDTPGNLLRNNAASTLDEVFRQLTAIDKAEEGVRAFLKALA